MKLSKKELKEFLDEKVYQYNQKQFIDTDPIYIPHLFTKKQDIEIAGFLSATIAWGQRKTILQNGIKLMQWMDYSPYNFILNFKENELFSGFKHRTFNGIDCIFFLKALQNIYQKHESLEEIFLIKNENENAFNAIIAARKCFFQTNFPTRSLKHFSDPNANSAAKRLNMYLRWMVRKDNVGVDFGLWNNIKPKHLLCPLDVHSGNVARKLGLLKRKQNDRAAVEELTAQLQKFDNYDPVKYDFALFGLGVFEKF
jgi:uncharacterized protein (TIGR02757 family)